MRRACPACGGAVLEDPVTDAVTCPVDGQLRAWLVLNRYGRVVAAGTASGPGVEGASWFSPDIISALPEPEPEAAA
jgi:hypothetical protein